MSTACILLAAGDSRRAGMPKGLRTYRGGPWLAWQVRALRGEMVVVTGADHDAYCAALPELERCFIRNPAPARGQLSSVQCGLAAVSRATRVFVLPIDVPAAAPAVWHALDVSLGGELLAAMPVYGGRGGHPVLLGHEMIGRVRALPADARLDTALRAAPVARVAVGDPSVVLNLNTPEAWQAFVTGSVPGPLC